MTGRPQLRRWQWTVALFLLGLGFVIALQFRAGQVLRKAFELPTLRVRDLAVLVRQQEEALAGLDAEVQTLRDKLTEYEAAAAQGTVSAETLTREVAFHRMVLGLTPVRGPGVLVQVREEIAPGGVLAIGAQAADLSGIVNELWASGAEAVAINGYRILATTGFKSDGQGILAGIVRLYAPYDIQAIGNAEVLKSALSLRGGLVEGLRSVGVIVAVEQQDTLVLPPYRGLLRPRYAVPSKP